MTGSGIESLAVGGGFAMFVIVMLASLADRAKINRITAKNNAEGLTLEFMPAPDFDSELYVRVFRLRVTNQYPSERVDNVVVELKSIEHDKWNDVNRPPYEVRQLHLPQRLPISPLKYTQHIYEFECGINAGSSVLFDLLYVRSNAGAGWHVGIAPFMPPETHHRVWRSECDFTARVATDQHPREIFKFLAVASCNLGSCVPKEGHLLFHGPKEYGLGFELITQRSLIPEASP